MPPLSTRALGCRGFLELTLHHRWVERENRICRLDPSLPCGHPGSLPICSLPRCRLPYWAKGGPPGDRARCLGIVIQTESFRNLTATISPFLIMPGICHNALFTGQCDRDDCRFNHDLSLFCRPCSTMSITSNAANHHKKTAGHKMIANQVVAHCALCSEDLQGAWATHCSSSGHLSRASESPGWSNPAFPSYRDSTVPAAGSRRCTVCHIDVPEEQWTLHNRTPAHRTKSALSIPPPTLRPKERKFNSTSFSTAGSRSGVTGGEVQGITTAFANAAPLPSVSRVGTAGLETLGEPWRDPFKAKFVGGPLPQFPLPPDLKSPHNCNDEGLGGQIRATFMPASLTTETYGQYWQVLLHLEEAHQTCVYDLCYTGPPLIVMCIGNCLSLSQRAENL